MNTVLLVVVVAVALGFDFTNGFHDTANYVATWVGTRALSPRNLNAFYMMSPPPWWIPSCPSTSEA